MILLGASISPFVRKVLVVAAEKGVKLENRPLNPSTSTDPLFLATSPFRKIPVLVDGDFSLRRLHGHRHLPGSTASQAGRAACMRPGTRARAIWFEEMADTDPLVRRHSGFSTTGWWRRNSLKRPVT